MELQQFSDVNSYTFLSEEDCEDFLMRMRWSGGFCCPRCDHHEAFKIRTRRLLECKDCRMQVSLTAGTIMHKSKLSLLHWFRAIQLLIEDKKEYTASSFSSILEINYRSAQLLLKKIHFAHMVKENRLCLFKKVGDAISNSSNQINRHSVEEVLQPNLNQSSPNEWNLLSYLESKINRLHSKLNIKHILLNECPKSFHSKTRTEFINACSDILFKNWIKTFLSIHLYLTFLKCFQLSY